MKNTVIPHQAGHTPAPLAPSPGVEPLMSTKDLTAVLGCSRRVVERMRAAGKLPRPDLSIGRLPRWQPQTIRRWIENGGRL